MHKSGCVVSDEISLISLLLYWTCINWDTFNKKEHLETFFISLLWETFKILYMYKSSFLTKLSYIYC